MPVSPSGKINAGLQYQKSTARQPSTTNSILYCLWIVIDSEENTPVAQILSACVVEKLHSFQLPDPEIQLPYKIYVIGDKRRISKLQIIQIPGLKS